MITAILSQSQEFNFKSKTIQLGRSLMALSTLLTLLFTNGKALFNPLETRLIESLSRDQHLLSSWGLFNLFPISELWISQLLAVVILGLVISGIYPRFTAPLHWWVSVSFATSVIPVEGGDQLNAVLSFLILPICLFDNRKNGWVAAVSNLTPKIALLCASFYWVLRLQVAMVYFEACTAKFNVPEWANGTATWYWFTNSIHGMPSWIALFMVPVLATKVGVVLFTWGALAMEGVLAFSLFMDSKYRKNLLVFAILFHMGIMFIHGLTSFFISMSAALILYLLPLGFLETNSALESVILSPFRYGPGRKSMIKGDRFNQIDSGTDVAL